MDVDVPKSGNVCKLFNVLLQILYFRFLTLRFLVKRTLNLLQDVVSKKEKKLSIVLVKIAYFRFLTLSFLAKRWECWSFLTNLVRIN